MTKDFLLNVKKEVLDKDIANGAAALAFYLMLSIFPAMIFLLALLSYLPIENLDQSILNSMSQIFPTQTVTMFYEIMQEITSEHEPKLVSLGFIATIWASSSGMAGIIRQLNKIYNVKERRPLWKSQALSVVMTLTFTPFITIALALIVLGKSIYQGLSSFLAYQKSIPIILEMMRFGVAIMFLLFSFSFIYSFAPNHKKDFKLFSTGSIAAVLILVLASLGFQYYLTSFARFSAMYGSISAVIILMLCLYIAGIALLFGAVLNAVLDKQMRNKA